MLEIATFDFPNRLTGPLRPGAWVEEMPLENKHPIPSEGDPFEGDDPSFWLGNDTDQTPHKR